MKTSDCHLSVVSRFSKPNITGRILKHLAQFWLFLAVVFTLPACLLAGEDKVEHETGFYYTIQKGDTLWDLSKRFSDSPWLWPELWKQNSQIANPHWIYPGERIRLYYKTGITDLTEAAAGATPAEPEKEPPYFFYSAMDTISFIKKAAIEPSGTIIKAKGKRHLLGTGDLIYIRGNGESPLIRGSRYTAYRLLNPVAKRNAKTYYGVQYYPTGVVEITSQEAGFILARVVRSYRTIGAGDILLPYQKRSGKIYLTESRKGLVGQIIGSEERENIMGDKTVAFIDKGEKDGVKPGQQYTLFYREKKRLDPKKKWKSVLFPTVEFGTLIVLHTEQDNATVLITRAEQSVSPGATFRTPAP